MTSETTHIDYETLMVRYLSGDASPDEQTQLLAWLKQNPENVKELNRLRNASEICKLANEKDSFNPDIAFSAFESTIAPKKTNKVRSIVLWSSSIAALLILFFGIKTFTSKQNDTIILLGSSSDAKRTIALIDGSTITLNAHSSLSAKNIFDRENRNVILKGEAFFDINHDAKHPFSVTVDSVTVKVLGTAFNILPDTISHNVVVTVQRGSVAVMYKDQSIIITAGEQVTFCRNQNNIGLTNSNIENYDSWRTGHLVFNDTPLKDVIEALNKQYSTQFEIASPELESCKLNASFSYTDIKKVEELLSVVLKVDIKRENGKQLLYSRSVTKNE